MKKMLLLVFPILFFSCSKSNTTSKSGQITGTVYYHDPASDGGGLYFIADSTQETIYFHNEYATYEAQYEAYKSWVSDHVRLTYIDKGERGCPFCQVPGAKARIVEVVRLEKD